MFAGKQSACSGSTGTKQIVDMNRIKVIKALMILLIPPSTFNVNILLIPSTYDPAFMQQALSR